MMMDELDEAVDALKEFGGKEGDKSLQIDSVLNEGANPLPDFSDSRIYDKSSNIHH